MTNNDQGQEVYEQLNRLGIFVADIGLLISTIIGVIMIILGVYFVCISTGISTGTDDARFLRVSGKVTGSNYDKVISNISVEYGVCDMKYNNKLLFTGKNPYTVGSQIDLMVSKSNHNIVKHPPESLVPDGLALFLMALIFFGMAYLNYYLCHNYKIYSAAQGVVVTLNLFRSVLQILCEYIDINESVAQK